MENPLKSEVIGRCGGGEKPNDHAEPTKVERQKKSPKTTTRNLQTITGTIWKQTFSK